MSVRKTGGNGEEVDILVCSTCDSNKQMMIEQEKKREVRITAY